MSARWQPLWRFGVGRHARTAGTAAQPLAALLRIAAGLPDDTRRVVTLHKVYDLAIPDIAARLAFDAQAVEQHLVRAALAFAGCAAHIDDAAARAARAHLPVFPPRTDPHISIDLSESDPPINHTGVQHHVDPQPPPG